MFKSIRWKLSILYFVLVFIAMAIVGVFISDQLEEYNLSIVRQNLTSFSNNTVRSIIPNDEADDFNTILQERLDNIALPVGYSISIIDESDFSIIAASNDSFNGKNALEVLDRKTLMSTLTNGSFETDLIETTGSNSITKIMAFYFDDGPKGGYIIYSSASLDGVYASLSTVTDVFLKATLVALVVAMVVGFLISGSITNPINDLNEKASLIAKGDFSQRVHLRSKDEIGNLGNTFNYLTKKLDSTLIEISSEKSKLDAVINNMADGLLSVDENGFVVLYNRALLELLGTSVDVVFGSNLKDIFKTLDIKLNFGMIKNCVFSNQNKHIIVTVSEDKILRLSPAYFSDNAKRQTGFILVFQDITDAQRLDNMRRDFVANVSHELKTPITTIKTYAETLSSGLVTEEDMQKDFLLTIENEADRMTSIVRDLLQLSSFDFKKAKWNFEHLPVEELITESINHLKIYYSDKNQHINFENPDNPMVLVDKSKIKQVLVNILSNANKYTPEFGNVDILVHTVDNFVNISIKDNGIGIPSEDIDHVFERFYRVDKGRSRQQGGTGLGLAISKDIVVEHGGILSAKSTLGEGSIFTISLPVDNFVNKNI